MRSFLSFTVLTSVVPDLDLARIDAAEGERADERVVHDLEGEHGERRLVLRLARHLLAGLDVDALDRGHVERRRQIVHHGVQHRLHALVLEGRAAQDRHEQAVDGALADQRLELGLARHLAFEIGLGRGLVDVDGQLHELLVILLGLIDEIRGNLLVMEARAQRLVVPHHRLHADEVDDALETRLDAERQLDHQRLGAEAVLDHLHREEEVGADLVHLVDEDHARHAVFVGLPPYRLGLRLHTLIGVEQRYRAVEHAQAALDLDGEIHVAGRVDDVDALVVPISGRRGGRDGDAALLLLLHPIHGGSAVMHFADLVALAGVIEDALGGRGLAGVDMRHDPDIAVVL